MALTGAPFPYDIDNLLSGAVRILYAPLTGEAGDAAVPGDMGDVFGMESPYASSTGWTDLGATSDSFTYSRGFETAGLEIQQVQGNILEEVTTITRTIQVSMAEFSPFGFQLMENAPSVATIAAAAGKSSQKKIAFGSFASVNQYRFAFVSRRPKAAGLVNESGGQTRGRFVAGVAYRAQMSADSVDMEQGKGTLTAVGITFSLFPEPGQPSEEEYGAWFLEDEGTITAV